MAQRNYLINITTIATTASGTTISSGNTQAAAFEVARTLVRTGIGADEFSSGSQTWAIHYVVSAMTTPYNMRLKVQRRNSSGVMQAESGYGATRSATGTYDDNLTADLGTWAANDQLALVWEHFRPSGTGNKNATIDANGASYIDAPITTTPLSQTAADDLNNLADAKTVVLGLAESLSDDLNNLADAHVEVLGLRIALSDDANLLGDYFTYGKRPRWQDAYSQSLAGDTTDRTVTAADSINNFAAAYSQILEYQLSFAEDINNLADAAVVVEGELIPLADNLSAWADDFTYGRRPRWQDSIAILTPDLTISLSDDLNNLNDALQLIEGELLSFPDNLDAWADDYAQSIGTNALTVIVSDDLNAWQDAVELDLQSAAFTRTLTDDLNNWQDAQVQILEHRLAFAEDANTLADELVLGYGLLATDGSSILADQYSLIEGHLIPCSDSVVLSDQLTMIEGQQVTLADDANNLNDAVTLAIILLLILADSSNDLADGSTLSGHGLLICEDSFALFDNVALNLHYLLTLADGENFLTESVGFSGAGIQAEDALDMSDAFSFSGGIYLNLSDQVYMSDAVIYFIPRASASVKVQREIRSVLVEP